MKFNRGRVYVAGPMSGYKDMNFPAFNAKADELRHDGFIVINPVDINPDPNADWKESMVNDIKALVDCDKIYMLKGWRSSRGASLEFSIAWALGLEVEYEDNNERVDHQRIEREARTA